MVEAAWIGKPDGGAAWSNGEIAVLRLHRPNRSAMKKSTLNGRALRIRPICIAIGHHVWIFGAHAVRHGRRQAPPLPLLEMDRFRIAILFATNSLEE